MQEIVEYNMVPPGRRPRDPQQASHLLIGLLVCGLLVSVIGYAVSALTASVSDQATGSGGSGLLGHQAGPVGGLVTLVGIGMVFVSLVGFGVKLGREASRV